MPDQEFERQFESLLAVGGPIAVHFDPVRWRLVAAPAGRQNDAKPPLAASPQADQRDDDLDTLSRQLDRGGCLALERVEEDAYREGLKDGAATRPQPQRRERKPRVVAPNGLTTMAEAAATLGFSVKTLKGHIASGALRYVVIGHGIKRPRRMFTEADIQNFIANQSRKDIPCLSTASRARHTGISTSRCEVIAFTAQPRPQRVVKPKG